MSKAKIEKETFSVKYKGRTYDVEGARDIVYSAWAYAVEHYGESRSFAAYCAGSDYALLRPSLWTRFMSLFK